MVSESFLQSIYWVIPPDLTSRFLFHHPSRGPFVPSPLSFIGTQEIALDAFSFLREQSFTPPNLCCICYLTVSSVPEPFCSGSLMLMIYRRSSPSSALSPSSPFKYPRVRVLFTFLSPIPLFLSDLLTPALSPDSPCCSWGRAGRALGMAPHMTAVFVFAQCLMRGTLQGPTSLSDLDFAFFMPSSSRPTFFPISESYGELRAFSTYLVSPPCTGLSPPEGFSFHLPG